MDEHKNTKDMEKSIYFSVSADVAERSTLKEVRYRTKDGRFILTDKDLQRVRLLPSEFINGLDAVMLKDKDEADNLIAEGGFLLGDQQTIFGSEKESEETEDAPATEETAEAREEEPAPAESEENSAEEAVAEEEETTTTKKGK